VHNGLAWLAQIGMFLVLGLLATPTRSCRRALPALAIAAGLIWSRDRWRSGLCLLPFRFPGASRLFIAWVGLRGAVPIILALFPLLAGIAQRPGTVLQCGLLRGAGLIQRVSVSRAGLKLSH
jgi:potassium/hydrogen antiporter